LERVATNLWTARKLMESLSSKFKEKAVFFSDINNGSPKRRAISTLTTPKRPVSIFSAGSTARKLALFVKDSAKIADYNTKQEAVDKKLKKHEKLVTA
jgi:hypothetical protein